MKFCKNCSASNAYNAQFCQECGTALSPIEPMQSLEKPAGGVDAASLAKSVPARAAALQGMRRADVMFVLDCTGSMQGEIDAIKDVITSFADTVGSEGMRVRVGLVEFHDRLIGEEHRVLTFAGEPFTADPSAFRLHIAALCATGGGEGPKSSLDAINQWC